MILEVLGFIGILILILIYLAEQKKPVLGIAGSLILFLTAFWVWGEGIQVQSGTTATLQLTALHAQNETAEQTDNTTATNLTGNYTVTGTATLTPDYTMITAPFGAAFAFKDFLGFIFMMLGTYGFWHYATIRYTQ